MRRHGMRRGVSLPLRFRALFLAAALADAEGREYEVTVVVADIFPDVIEVAIGLGPVRAKTHEKPVQFFDHYGLVPGEGVDLGGIHGR